MFRMASIALALSGALLAQQNTNPVRASQETSLPLGVLKVELTRTLDAKKLNVGDPVLARLSEDAHLKGGIVIPKNSKLLGHVVHASARARGAADSQLVLAFDKVLVKDGREVPISANIDSLSAPDAVSKGNDNALSGAAESFSQHSKNSPKPMATGIDGVELDSDMKYGAQASVLRSSGENLRVESGAHMTLRVIQQ